MMIFHMLIFNIFFTSLPKMNKLSLRFERSTYCSQCKYKKYSQNYILATLFANFLHFHLKDDLSYFGALHQLPWQHSIYKMLSHMSFFLMSGIWKSMMPYTQLFLGLTCFAIWVESKDYCSFFSINMYNISSERCFEGSVENNQWTNLHSK